MCVRLQVVAALDNTNWFSRTIYRHCFEYLILLIHFNNIKTTGIKHLLDIVWALRIPPRAPHHSAISFLKSALRTNFREFFRKQLNGSYNK